MSSIRKSKKTYQKYFIGRHEKNYIWEGILRYPNIKLDPTQIKGVSLTRHNTQRLGLIAKRELGDPAHTRSAATNHLQSRGK